MLIPLGKILTKYNLKPKGILHIGASTGQEAQEYKRCGITDVVFVEAIPFVFEELKRNLQPYSRMIAINACVTDEDWKIVTFNISNNEAQSSSILQLGTHKTAHPEVKYISSINLITKRIDTLMRENELNIDNFDFLNIDLQGAELMALKGIGEDLNKVKAIYIEVNKEPLYVGCPLINEIDDFLWLFGFERVETEWCGNFGWGDALYIKK
jgi:FkbM family methyltransferase